MTDQVEMDSSAHYPGTAPETMDDLRQECSMLRQKVSNLEAEKTELEAAVRDWRTWYSQSYRPQIEFLDTEVSRLCAFAPLQKPRSSPSPGGSPVTSFGKGLSGAPPAAVPPGMRRGTSEPRLRRSVKLGGQRTGDMGLSR
mmetsp:Transcript_33350/g.94925  ORF Transcript_33350/g.94925 Transcript_33350/m.94925 type:complete len:141 (-) Transcript_33350:142-564(-)